MPVINIQMMEGRTEDKVKRLIAEITETTASTLDISKDRVRVIITEVPKSRWGIAGVQASEMDVNV